VPSAAFPTVHIGEVRLQAVTLQPCQRSTALLSFRLSPTLSLLVSVAMSLNGYEADATELLETYGAF
jgi:hypothetical protein